MALYPPTLASSQDAFLASETGYKIYFTLSNLTKYSDIGHAGVKVVNAANNVPVYSGYDGIIYVDTGNIRNEGGDLYSISLEMLDGRWTLNTIYKVQINFGKDRTQGAFTSTNKWTVNGSLDMGNGKTIQNFIDWKNRAAELGNFTEWSTVMVLKPLAAPTIEIANYHAEVNGRIDAEVTTTPLFSGCFRQYGEPEKEYRFVLKDINDNIYEDSKWQVHRSNSGLDSWRFRRALISNDKYTLYYYVRTINGYECEAEPYHFQVTYSTPTSKPMAKIETFVFKDGHPYGNEEACIDIMISTLGDATLAGNYVLSRTDEHSNFQVWQDIYFFNAMDQKYDNELLYRDFTIETGVEYKYALQSQNVLGYRPMLRESNDPTVYTNAELQYKKFETPRVDFQYAYLFRDGVQVKLKFNNKMNSFKHTVIANKQDTLGGKYPTIHRNGESYYAEFPVNGLISLSMDENANFFSEKNDGYYYKDELIIPKEWFSHYDSYNDSASRGNDNGTFARYNRDMTNDNIFIERKFREKVEEFLNDGSYKLYKSPTEGNMIVTLMNVSMTPEEKLGRMIFSFTATAYEVADCTLDNMNTFGIINVGEYKKDIATEQVFVGQLAGQWPSSQNLVELITNQMAIKTGENNEFTYLFKRFKDIWIEAYPKIDLSSDINLFKSQLAAGRQDETWKSEDDKQDYCDALEAKITELESLQEAASAQTSNPIVTLKLNNATTIRVGPNKPYYIPDAEKITSISVEDFGYGSGSEDAPLHLQPIVINYSCYVAPEESRSEAVSEPTLENLWGNISGVFSNSTSILRNYAVENTAKHYLLNSYQASTGLNYDVYGSLDIMEVIRDTLVKELSSGPKKFKQVGNNIYKWKSIDNTVEAAIDRFDYIDIETVAGTVIRVKDTRGNNQRIVIGAPLKKNTYYDKDTLEQQPNYESYATYRLTNIGTEIIGIEFEEPSFALVNYSCSISQVKKGETRA